MLNIKKVIIRYYAFAFLLITNSRHLVIIIDSFHSFKDYSMIYLFMFLNCLFIPPTILFS